MIYVDQPTTAAAVNAMFSTANEVVLCAGLWDITEPIVVPSYCRLVGSGRRSTLLRGPAGYQGALVHIDGGSNQSLENLGIDRCGKGVFIDSASDVEVAALDIRSASVIGLHCLSSNHCHAEKCKVLSTDRPYVWEASREGGLDRCRSGGGSVSFEIAQGAGGSSNVSAWRCSFESFTQSGVHLNATSAGGVFHCWVDGTRLESTAQGALGIEFTEYATYCIAGFKNHPQSCTYTGGTIDQTNTIE